MKTKHTPGPWNGIRRNMDDSTSILNYDHVEVCVVVDPEANARLIASAPELLEALKIAIKCLHETGGHTARFEALIAKATGGAE